MNQKFKVGDRVRIVESCLEDTPAGKAVIGSTGTIVKIDEPPYPYAVHRDANPDPHSIHWCAKIEPLKSEKHPVIVITTDGKTTTATKRLGKRVLNTATARCNPDDTFDFDIGAAIALARLCGGAIRFHGEEPEPEKPKWPEKVVCTESNEPWWTVGKIYKVKGHPINGAWPTVADDGDDDLGSLDWDLRRTSGGFEVHTFERDAFFLPLVED